MSELSERIRNRVNDLPLTTEYLLDETADALDARNALIEDLVAAHQKIVDMNVQYAIDKFGNPDEAETMACVKTSRSALAAAKAQGYGGKDG